ncbi:unnamed protein product, partial [Didymodactylos carnosus]
FIQVPVGFVAVAFDIGKQIIIRPEDTESGPFETNSATFLFDKQNGFQSVQLQVRELDELKVNTRDGITIIARGLITYRIHDPRSAFMTVQDIHGAVKRGAEATLTKHVREAFLHDFSRKVHEWGIELKDLNLEKLEFDGNVKDLLRKRAQARIETATNLANMYSQTEIAMQQADREKRQQQIKAEAEASVIKTRADAEYYAAERHVQGARLLQEVPLSAQLELKRLDVEMIRATGDKTTFLPLNMQIGSMNTRDPNNGQMYWTMQNNDAVTRM